MKKRIDTRTSRTAEWTCICRAASALEERELYQSGDTVALRILPFPIKGLIQMPFYRIIHCRYGIPRGIYEYVIARTKYMDAAYERAVAERFDPIVLLGAGFDTRAIRFPAEGQTQVYEFDSKHTQEMKFHLFNQNNVPLPGKIHFEGIDFAKESLPERLEVIGFPLGKRGFFLMEGVSMYLEPEAIEATFQTMAAYMGPGSRVAFDYVYADVIRGGKQHYGEREITKAVSRVNEAWRFGIEKDGIEAFLTKYGLRVVDHMSAREMEERYFKNEGGVIVGQVNDTHCFVTAEKG